MLLLGPSDYTELNVYFLFQDVSILQLLFKIHLLGRLFLLLLADFPTAFGRRGHRQCQIVR